MAIGIQTSSLLTASTIRSLRYRVSFVATIRKVSFQTAIHFGPDRLLRSLLVISIVTVRWIFSYRTAMVDKASCSGTTAKAASTRARGSDLRQYGHAWALRVISMETDVSIWP